MSRPSTLIPSHPAQADQDRDLQPLATRILPAQNNVRTLMLRYGVAFVSAALAVLLREAFNPLWGYRLPFLTLFPAVFLSAWYGGLGPGLVTTVLCAVAADYLWLAPFYSLTTGTLADQVGLALAVLVMLLITWLTAALRRAQDTLGHRVQERTAELTRANSALQAEVLERQRTEEALQMSFLVLEHMAEGVAMTDENGTIAFVNPAFSTMFGYANGELRGQNVAILNAYTPEETTRFIHQLGEVLRTQGTWDGEIDNRKKDGTMFTSSCHIKSLEMAGKTYWVGVQQDITARKRAEAERTQLLAQIKSERARLTTTLEHIPVGVIFSDAVTGKTLLANDQAKRIWHYDALPDFYSPEFARYQGFFPDGRPYQIEDWPVQRALKAGETTTGEEITFIRGDGTRGVMLASAAPIRNPDGDVAAAVVTFADITARKKMEQELRALNVELEQRVLERTEQLQQQNEELRITEEELRQQTEELLAARESIEQERQRYQALFEFAPDGYVVTDREGIIREVNEAVFSLLRVPPNSLKGKSLLAFIAKTEMKEYHSRLTSLLQSSGTDEWELLVQPRSGATFTAGLRVASVIDPTGKVEGLRWMLRDITTRKQAEAALQESEARFRLLADSAPVLIWVNDLKGCEFVNQEYRRFLGVTETEVHGYDWTPFVHPEDREAYVTAYLDALARRGPFQAQFRFRRNDGTYRWMHSVALPRLNTQGECLGYVGSSTDVTDLKEAEDELANHTRNLEHANADLRQIAYITAHDLQEPVRQVGLYTQWLAQRYRDFRDAETTQAMDFILDGARRMQAQFTDLRHYLEVDELGHSVTTTDCEAVLGNAAEALREQLAARGATITHDPLPTLDANAHQLQLVFQELIDNALKFRNDEPPKIRVWAVQETGGWRFAVRDNGIGIDPQYQGQLFGLFRQLQRYTAYPGTGMGLAICKKIVERHKGRIWVESTPGKGTTFYFTIGDRKQ